MSPDCWKDCEEHRHLTANGIPAQSRQPIFARSARATRARSARANPPQNGHIQNPIWQENVFF
jgi:hypothetical protein